MQKNKITLILALCVLVFGLLFVLGLLICDETKTDFMNRIRKGKPVANFEQCVNAGYPVMESYPRKCALPGGETFIEEINQKYDL